MSFVSKSKSKSSSKSSYSYHSSSLSSSMMNNEFLEFYADLHKSAVLYSDPDFQQKVLYGLYPSSHTHDHPVSIPTPSGSGQVRGGHKKEAPVIATSSVRRKVSFSKHSPRLNLITPTPPTPLSSCSRDLPRITIEEQTSSCWSSDMEESDTTETERATSEKDSDFSDFKQLPVKLGMKPSPIQLVAPTEGTEVTAEIDVNKDLDISMKFQDEKTDEVVDLEDMTENDLRDDFGNEVSKESLA